MTKIKLFATDVDGTMTDGCMYYAENGMELKKFNFRDGMGFQLLREAGIKTAIITDVILVKKLRFISYIFQCAVKHFIYRHV